MYKLGQLFEDGIIRLNGQEIADTIQYVNGDYVKKYRELNLALGKEILVLTGGTEKKALALDVDDQCRLLVRYEDGTEAALSYGEISTRML